MKLAVESYVPVLHYGLEKGLAMIKDAGFDAVDFTFYYENTATHLSGDYIKKAYEIRDCIAATGLSCSQAHAPFTFTYGKKEDESEPAFLNIKKSIEAAGIIGVDHIVIHGFSVPEGNLSEESVMAAYTHLSAFTECARKAGVKISIENLSASLTRPEQYIRCYEMLDPDVFTCLIDIGHVWLHTGESPAGFIKSLKPGLLTGLHVHDNHGFGSKDEHILPGMGTLPYKEVTDALAEYGYAGDLTMELGGYLKMYAPELLPEALVFAEKVGRNLIAQIESH